MIHDATIEVTCDGGGCTESLEINPPVIHRSYGDVEGEYDTRTSTVNKLVREHGWAARGDKHYCEDCQR